MENCTTFCCDSQCPQKGRYWASEEGQEVPAAPYFLLIPALLNAGLCLVLASAHLGFFNGCYSPIRLVASLSLFTRENWGLCLNHRSSNNRAELDVVGGPCVSTAHTLSPEALLDTVRHPPWHSARPFIYDLSSSSGSRRIKDQLWGWMSLSSNPGSTEDKLYGTEHFISCFLICIMQVIIELQMLIVSPPHVASHFILPVTLRGYFCVYLYIY